MKDVFISYARADESFVKQLYEDLSAAGIDVWWDRKAMKSRGRTFAREIQEAIIEADRLLLVVSEHIDRPYVNKEWRYALEHCVAVIPVLLDCDPEFVPAPLRNFHAESVRSKIHKEDLKRVIEILREPVAPPGPMYGVQPLPPQYLPRAEEIDRLRELVIPDTLGPAVVTSTKTGTALSGMGGVGKTVLAAAFAQACDTRRAFSGGVVWTRLGQKPNLTLTLRAIGQALGDDRIHDYTDREIARGFVSDLFRERECLVVFDDVWTVADVEPVLNTLGPRCRALITSRDVSLARNLAGQALQLNLPGDDAALELLANWSGTSAGDLPPEAHSVVTECGNLPLALALCGAMARDGVQWTHLLEALQEADLDYIESVLPGYDYPGVLRSIDVSVEALRDLELDRLADAYLSLVIFPDGDPIPLAAIETFWTHRFSWNVRTVDKVLTILERRALLVRNEGRVTLHDLQHDYLRAKVPETASLHADLVAAYEKNSPGGWVSGPNDGYFFARFASHLAAAGLGREARDLLLDFDWLLAVLKSDGAAALVSQYDELPPAHRLETVGGCLRLTAHVIEADHSQLASQLMATLLDDPDPDVQRLLVQARENALRPWLRPRIARLTSPGQGLLRTLEGHSDIINAVKFTPDGKRAVSCSREGSILVWDLSSGRAVQSMVLPREMKHTDYNRVLRAVPVYIYDVALVSQGRQVVSGSSDNAIRVWDIESGELIRRMDKHESGPTSLVAVSEQHVVSASMDRVILWDVTTGEPIETVDGPNHTVNCLAVSPDKRHLIWEAGNAIEVRDPENLQLVRSIGTKGNIAVVAVSNNGLIISAGSDQILRTWDARTGESLSELPISKNYKESRGSIAVGDLALLRDDRHVLLSYAKGMFFCDLQGESDAIRISNQWVESLDVLPDGSRAVVGLNSGKIQYWDLTSAHRKTRPSDGSTTKVAFTPTGEFILEIRNNNLVCWDVQEVVERWTLPAHEDAVSKLVVTPDGRFAITASQDCTLKVFDILRPEIKHVITGHSDRVTDVVVYPDSSFAISASDDMTARVWDLESGKEVLVLRGHSDTVSAVTCAPDASKAITASEDELLYVWNLQNGEILHALYGHPKWVDAVLFLPSGDRAISTSGRLTPTMYLWDIETGEGLGGANAHSPLAVSTDGRWVAANTSDIVTPKYSIGLWDLSGVEPVRSLEGLKSDVTQLVFAPDNEHLLSASGDGVLRLWDVSTGRLITSYDGERAFSTCAISPDGLDIAAGNALGLHLLRFENGNS